MNEAAAPITTQAASEETQRNFTARSSSVEAQRARIIAALRERPHTSYELRRLGSFQSAARVLELRYQFGFDIRTERVTLYDRDGFVHPNAARYHLEREPEDGFIPKSHSDAASLLREAAKVIRAQAKGLERDSIKLEHIPNVRQHLIDALRVLSALERAPVGLARGNQDARASA